MIPDGEVGCKICDKSIYRIFVDHIQKHLEEKDHLDNVRIARQCLNHCGFTCSNKRCTNEACPLNSKYKELER